MTPSPHRWISDAAITRLRRLEDWPDFTGTRYEIDEVIGRGGMGIVFRGRDRALDREVAIKVTSLATADDAARLRAEARTLARLEHPGIVAVHDVGQLADGRVFAVMRLVRGARLDACAPALTLADRLRLFDRMCEAVAFAHARGVVHGDLTPANIMVGAHSDLLVVDWGLARRSNSEFVNSQLHNFTTPKQLPTTNEIASESRVAELGVAELGRGTEGYRAPEPGGGPRADVYALGAILRDLLPSPRTRAMRPLDSVVRRATAADPGRRYPGAAELAEDVRHFVDGAAVAAHRESVAEQAVRLARAYRTPIGLVLAYLAMRSLLLYWQ